MDLTGGEATGGGDATLLTYRFIDTMGDDLETLDFLTAQETAGLELAAKNAVGADSDDVSQTVEPIIDGTSAGLGALDLTTEQTLTAMDTVIVSLMTSIKENKAEAFVTRAIDAYASNMSQILAQISAASIRNLSNAGLEEAEIGDAAQRTVQTLVSSLDKGGVAAGDVPSVIQVITQSAVENVVNNTPAAESAVILDSVKKITRGAVSAVDKIRVEGFSSAQVSDVVGKISSGATAAINTIADDVAGEGADQAATDEAVTSLAREITIAAIGGVDDLVNQSASGDQTLGIKSSDIAGIIERVTEESVGAISKVDSVRKEAGDASTQNLIKELTKASSLAAIGMTSLSEADKSSVTQAIVTGASDGAQAIDNAFDKTALSAVIVIDEDGDATTDDAVSLSEITNEDLKTELSEAVDKGIIRATNTPPVADAGPNIDLAYPLDQIALDGSASMDADEGDSIVEYDWFISVKPVDSEAAELIQDRLNPLAEFIPDVAGDYVLVLRVTDSFGESRVNSLNVAVQTPAEDVNYNGMTAEERLAEVKRLRHDEGDDKTALVELNKILSFYPRTDLFAEAYLIKAYILWNRGEQEQVKELLELILNDAEWSQSKIDAYWEAKGELGWLLQTWEGATPAGKDYAAAKVHFDEMIDQKPGTVWEATANWYLGWGIFDRRDSYSGDWAAEAGAYYDEVINATASHNWVLYSALRGKGDILRYQGDEAGARAAWEDILSNTSTGRALLDPYYEEEEVPAYGTIFNAHARIADSYWRDGDLTEEVRLTSYIAQMQAVIDQTDYAVGTVTMADQYKNMALRKMGYRYHEKARELQDRGDRTGAIDYFELAEAKYLASIGQFLESDPRETSYSYSDLAWMYRNWIRDLRDEGAAEADIQDISDRLTALDTGVSAMDVEVSRDARIWTKGHIGGHLVFDLPDAMRDYDGGLAYLKEALVIAEANETTQRAWLIDDLASVYRDLGWRNRRKTDINWRGYFQTALGYYRQLTFDNISTHESWMTHLFLNAPNRIAECYRGLEEYATAIDYLEEYLAEVSLPDSGFETADLARIQMEIGNNYKDLARDYRNRSWNDQAVATFDRALEEYETAEDMVTAADYNSADDYQWFINDVNQNKGYCALEKGWIIKDRYNDYDAALPSFDAALTYYQGITDLGNNWSYFEARRNLVEVYKAKREYNNALTALDNVLDIVDRFDPDRRGEILVSKGDIYREEFHDYDRSSLNWEDRIATLYADALAAYDAAIDAGLDGRNEQRAHRHKGYIIQDYANSILWGQEGFDDEMDRAVASFEEAVAIYTDSGFNDEYKDDAANAQNHLGYGEHDRAHSYGDRYDWNDGNGYDPALFRTYLNDSIAAHLKVIDDYSGIDTHELFRAKSSIVNNEIDIINSYPDDVAFSTLESHLINAFGYIFEVLAGTLTDDVDEREACQVMLEAARMNIRYDGQTIATDAGDYEFSYEEAIINWLQPIMDTYSHIEFGRYAAEAQNVIGHAYRADGNDLRDTDKAGAIASYKEAAAAYLKVGLNYPDLHLDDEWLLEDAREDWEWAWMDVGRTYEEMGTATEEYLRGAIDAFSRVVAMRSWSDAYYEAESRLDALLVLADEAAIVISLY